MIRTPAIPRKKPQARTEVRKSQILDAAQSVFAELGFESTQLEEVAARAGCSRGAIYAHYASKEEVFLELIKQRVYPQFAVMRKQLEDEPDVKKRPGIFRRWITSHTCDTESGTLTLEFKLYAARRPELWETEKLSFLYEALFRDSDKDFVEILFGKLPKAARTTAERRMAVFGGAMSAMILESRLRPELLPPGSLEQMAGELFDALIHT